MKSTEVPHLLHEQRLWRAGLRVIAGLDESGRGAWAGPVVAAAVILPNDQPDLRGALEGVRDSKMMTPTDRERWAGEIRHFAVGVGIGQADNGEIDELGLLPATRLAMMRALSQLKPDPEYLLIDHLPLPESDLDQTAITRGDASVLSIASASVIAKVFRDLLMTRLDREHPGYGFASHKGYGTRGHRDALRRLSACDIHRRSYAPVAALLGA
jgi:ribonuclease HII